MTETEYLRSFDAALDRARLDDQDGAAELWTLYQYLAGEYEDVLSRLDSYKDESSYEAQALYHAICKSIKA